MGKVTVFSVLIIGTCSLVDLVSQYWKPFLSAARDLKKCTEGYCHGMGVFFLTSCDLQVVQGGVRNLIRICENVSSTAFLAMEGLDIGHWILLGLRI